MKKKYVVIIILLISFFALLYNKDKIRPMVGKAVPTKIKTQIKDFFLGKGSVEQFNKLKEYGKMNYNQTLLPKTQFTNINFEEISLRDLNITEGNYYDPTKDPTIHNKIYIEQFNDKLVMVDAIGNIFFVNMQFVVDSKEFNGIQVDSNFNSQDGRVKDILILDDEIYISYAEFATETKDCDTVNISKAKISKKKLNFEIFFKSKDCRNEFNAGRMAFYSHEGKEGLLLSTGAELKHENHDYRHLAQDDNSIFGKILFIDFETNNYIIFSKGHRVPQGLIVEKNFILSTEHGPRGGDEINLIQFEKNYGWPISSYGENYVKLKKNSNVYDYSKNHSDHGFVEPIYSFVPSIGISQIIKIPDNFSEYWKNNFFVTSLNGLMIYRILFDKNFTRMIYDEKIYIGKRIRDIYYFKEFNVFLLSLDGHSFLEKEKYPSIGILSNSLD